MRIPIASNRSAGRTPALVLIATGLLLTGAGPGRETRLKPFWEEVDEHAQTPEARWHHSVTAVGNVIYVAGGVDASGKVIGGIGAWGDHDADGDFEWEKKSPEKELPARASHAAWSHDEKLYIHGGAGQGPLFDDLWEYDPGREEWSQMSIKGDVPPKLAGHNAVSFDDYILLFGGVNDRNQPNTKAWRIDAKTSKAVELTGDAPLEGDANADAVVDSADRVIVHGGWNSTAQEIPVGGTETGVMGDNKSIDWTGQPRLHSRRGLSLKRAAAASVVHDGKLLILGGYDQKRRLTNRAYALDLGTLEIKRLKGRAPTKFAGAAAAMFKDSDGKKHALIFGGAEKVDEPTNTTLISTPDQ